MGANVWMWKNVSEAEEAPASSLGRQQRHGGEGRSSHGDHRTVS